MDLHALLNGKTAKATGKRNTIADALKTGGITMENVMEMENLDDRQIGIVLEAMEAVTQSTPEVADEKWLAYATKHLDAVPNSVKREASRVVGNIAHLFPSQLSEAVGLLLENSKDAGTVIRWGSAYALSRIIVIPEHADSSLFDVLTTLADTEEESGVKNQYLKGIKKAQKLRK